jgi:hypothetical protein
MRDITPEHLKCAALASCPSVHQRKDGMLVIVGKRASPKDLAEGDLPRYDLASEEVILIDPAYLANVPRVKAEHPDHLAAYRKCVDQDLL